MRRCLRAAIEKHGSPVVIVIDNAPCHSSMEEILNEEEFIGNRILRLSPYSPMFNPIENIWSILKAYVKRILASRISNVLNSNLIGISVREHRLRVLETLINEGLNEITPQVCISCISSIQGKVSDALSLQDMQF